MKHSVREYKCYTDLSRLPGWLIFAALLCILLLPQAATAQQDSLLSVWAEFVEEDASLIDNIYYLLENPLNVNRANKDELLQLPFLIAQQADSIISYRRMHGRIRRKTELRKIIGSWTFRLIKDFIVLKTPSSQSLRLTHRNVYPFDPAAFYVDGTYEGSPLSDYNKVYIKLSQNLRAGLVTQKDAGEASFADYFNGYICYEKKDWQIIAGKYYPQFGEGLVFSNPFAGLKSANSLAVFSAGLNRAHPSLSSYENGGMFGLYLQTPRIKHFSLSFFVGNNFRDARYSADGHTVIGFDYDGYHRNADEIEAKNAVREQVAGLTVDKIFGRHFRMAALISRFKYSPEINFSSQTVPDNEYRRNIFNFCGDALTAGAIAYRFSWRHLSLKGEGALSNPGGYAVTQALLLRSHRFGFGVKIWRASNDFQSPAGRLFDNQTPFPQGQQGIYIAASLHPLNRIEINAYHIFKKDLWRGYFNDMPQWQKEWLVEGRRKSAHAYLTLRVRHKEATGETAEKQWLYRVQMAFPIKRRFKWTIRWQHTALSPYSEKGSYVFQDFNYIVHKRFSVTTRITFFHTASYRSRLYEYESDLPGSFANYALYGEGYKWYIRFTCQFSRSLKVWFKYRCLRQNRKDLLQKTFGRQATLNRLLRVQLQLDF